MLKKRGQGAPSKSDHFCCRFRVRPEGVNGALASTGTPFSLWEANPKRPPKGEPKGSVLEAQISTILLLGLLFGGKGPSEVGVGKRRVCPVCAVTTFPSAPALKILS